METERETRSYYYDTYNKWNEYQLYILEITLILATADLAADSNQVFIWKWGVHGEGILTLKVQYVSNMYIYPNNFKVQECMI